MTRGDEALLAELRQPTFAIAYRMLGSVAEAEDVVQETLLRVHRSLEEGPPLGSPRAFAATVATRLAIDGLRSARAAAPRWRARCWPGRAWAGATRARTSARWRSTASRARSCWTARGRWSA